MKMFGSLTHYQTDNTEAKLIVGEQRPVVTSTSTFGSSLGTQDHHMNTKISVLN